MKKRIKAKIELAKFLQDAVDELGTSEMVSKASDKGLDFGEFMKKVLYTC